MVDYLSDDEQAEALKSWIRQNWSYVLLGVALGLALLAGWRYYQSYATDRGEAAAELFREYVNAFDAHDQAKLDGLFKQLDSKYATSPYADQVRLLQAQTHVGAGEFDKAAADLRAVADNSKDDELAKVAKLRLARVLIQQGHHDDALKLLDAAQAGAFEAQVREIKGDALLAKGDPAQARKEYQAALAVGDAGEGRRLLELKLQDLEIEPAAAATAQAKP
jgi:predicted negative regulator of RcsB-dependent stress response